MIKSIIKTINLRNDVRSALDSFFDRYLTSEMIVYDIGCGPNPFSKKLKERVHKHIGVDIEDGFYEKGYIDLVGSAYDVPVADKEADVVISSQVLEHLETPEKAIEETSRILKSGGLLICSFPFLYPIHAAPHDYTRYTEHKMQKSLEANGLTIVEQERIGGFWYIAGMYLGLYLQTLDRGLLNKLKIIKGLSWLVRWSFLQIHRIENLLLHLTKKDPKLFRKQWTVNYVIVAKKT